LASASTSARRRTSSCDKFCTGLPPRGGNPYIGDEALRNIAGEFIVHKETKKSFRLKVNTSVSPGELVTRHPMYM
jgi:hypothetical protein